tara:strand:+ start:302 stop:496 length:195 start_codon:yes stop_codon:yes gene_type:complete
MQTWLEKVNIKNILKKNMIDHYANFLNVLSIQPPFVLYNQAHFELAIAVEVFFNIDSLSITSLA